jgi:flagellar FliL protein
MFVPGVQDAVRKIIPGATTEEEAADAPAARPIFVELPEMTLTLPNGGRPRQLRLKLAMEVNGDPANRRPN